MARYLSNLYQLLQSNQIIESPDGDFTVSPRVFRDGSVEYTAISNNETNEVRFVPAWEAEFYIPRIRYARYWEMITE